MSPYRFSPHVYLESFAEEAILLVSDRDIMVTVNLAAAQLFVKARELVGDTRFSRSDCIDFLLDQYELDVPEAQRQTRSLIGFALQHDLILRCK